MARGAQPDTIVLVISPTECSRRSMVVVCRGQRLGDSANEAEDFRIERYAGPPPSEVCHSAAFRFRFLGLSSSSSALASGAGSGSTAMATS